MMVAVDQADETALRELYDAHAGSLLAFAARSLAGTIASMRELMSVAASASSGSQSLRIVFVVSCDSIVAGRKAPALCSLKPSANPVTS